VIVNPTRFPQGAQTIGPLIGAIDHLRKAPPQVHAFVHWLQAPE